jgi:signal transduction histidine kinase
MILADINPRILILGGAAIFSVLVFFIIMFVFLYQKRHHQFLREKQELQNSFQSEILKTQLETQEETFHKIGEELHDNIGQLLSSTRMLLGITERSLPEVPDTFRTADQTLAKAIQDLRMLSKSLNREWLNQFNLLENLHAEIERINAAGTIHVHLNALIRSLPLNPSSQIMLFRVIQEALQNSVKHAHAANLYINVSADEMVRISLRDDGKGFNMQEQGRSGVGLINMNNRTRLLGGTIAWHRKKENGTEVIIQIPAQVEPNEN